MATTDAARIVDVTAGFDAVATDANFRMKRDGSNTLMSPLQQEAFRAAIGVSDGGGDVVGPSSSLDGSLVAFDGITGKLVKAGPDIGVTSASSILDRSSADDRYQAQSTGLTSLSGLTSSAIYYLSSPGIWSPVSIGSGLTFTGGSLTATGGGSGGDVFGPSSATNDSPAVFDGATGKLLKVGAFPVVSVAGKTGAVSLVKADVGLGNVDNTSDANKPVSTAQQTALDLKAALSDVLVTISTTTHTILLADLGKVHRFTNTSGCAVTLPNNAPAGFNLLWRKIGAGTLTFSAQAGGSLTNRQGHTKSAGAGAEGSLAVDTNSGANAAWWLSGDTAA